MKINQIRNKIESSSNVNTEHKNRLSSMDKLALFVTNRIGTMGFFVIIFSWTVLWLMWNIFAPISLRFDPYPSFVLWLFISNLIQLHLLPLIMIGQNIQGRHAEIRAEYDYQTNKKAEKEVETIINTLTEMNKKIDIISERLSKLEIRSAKEI